MWLIVITRLRVDARTKAYRERRTRDGRSLKEIIRGLRRYVVRDFYSLLIADFRAAQALVAGPP